MILKKKAGILMAVAAGVGLLLLAPALAYASPVSTKKITITRDAADPTKIQIAWQAVEGAHHYNVSIFDGTTDDVKVVPAKTTTLSLVKKDSCLRLRINIGSRDAAGLGATSKNVWLKSLAPGGISGLRASRNTEGTQVTAQWKAPTWPGYGAAGTYRIQLLRSTDKTVAFDGEVSDTSATMDGLDPAVGYTVVVTPQNTFGSCSPSKLPVGTSLPGSVSSLKVVRDVSSPSLVRISWAVPAYQGLSPVTHYKVGHGATKPTEFITVKETSAELTIDPEVASVIQVQAFNSLGGGRLGSVKLPALGATPVAAVKPGITIETSGAQIIVRLTGRVGANTDYPKLVVRIKQASASTGFTDEQWGQNGAQVLTFGDVPTGFYLVQVNGANDSGEVEWARKTINIGDAGAMTTESWQVVRGKATIRADVVSTDRNSSETEILSAAETSTANMALSSTITLQAGRGYGVLVRASVDKGKQVSGYLVEYDPGYSKKSASVGPSIALRTRYQGKTCGTALTAAKVPTSIAAAGVQHLLVIISGDSLYVTIDDTIILDLPSITAVTPAACKSPVPSGSQAGLWAEGGSNSTVTFTHTSVN